MYCDFVQLLPWPEVMEQPTGIAISWATLRHEQHG